MTTPDKTEKHIQDRREEFYRQFTGAVRCKFEKHARKYGLSTDRTRYGKREKYCNDYTEAAWVAWCEAVIFAHTAVKDVMVAAVKSAPEGYAMADIVTGAIETLSDTTDAMEAMRVVGACLAVDSFWKKDW